MTTPLTVRALLAILSSVPSRHLDSPIHIVRADPSVGPRAMTGLASFTMGFDWDNGRALLHPCEPLHARTDDAEIKRLRDALDGRTWEYNSLSQAVDELYAAADEYGRLHQWMVETKPAPEDYTAEKAKAAAERFGRASDRLKQVREMQKPQPKGVTP